MTDQPMRKLREPVLDAGIKNVNFFNGRVLTAGDLVDEQAANRLQRQQLGLAIGAGVVSGLEVILVDSGATTETPIVAVTAGLAINRLGQAIALPNLVQLALGRQLAVPPPDAGLFADCAPPKQGPDTTNKGIYILVISPTSGYSENELAPKVGVGGNGKADGCGLRYAVEGVRFRVEELQLAKLSKVKKATLDMVADLLGKSELASFSEAQRRPHRAKLRNLLAHLCFGTEELAGWVGDPFRRSVKQPLNQKQSPYLSYGALDAMRAEGQLAECDVPLALLCWTDAGIRFVDMWSARRCPARSSADARWPLLVGDRRLSEAEAILLQFEDQIEEVRAVETALTSVAATERFAYLPPAGLLPIGGSAFSREVFFRGLQTERVTADAAFLRLLVHESLFVGPIDLSDPPPIRIYEPAGVTGYLVFARAEKRAATGQSPPTVVGEGQINVELTVENPDELAAAVKAGGGEAQKGQATGQNVITIAEADIKVVARDKQLGHEYPALYVNQSIASNQIGKKGVTFAAGMARFTIAELPPGSYIVEARLRGYLAASQSAIVKAGVTTTVRMKLTRQKPGPGGPPSKPGGLVTGKGKYKKITPIDKYIRWPKYFEDKEYIEFDPLGDPPEEFGSWVTEVANWLHEAYPEAPISAGDAVIYIDPQYTTAEIADEPYAYLVFGDSGAYVPLTLTPADQALEFSVPVSKGGLDTVDSAAADKLQAVGAGELDVLAGAWKGLVSDTLGLSATAAGDLIAETRVTVDQMQGSVRMFSGVDSAKEQALQVVGITSSAELANYEPEELRLAISKETIGEAGVAISPVYARKLVEEARSAVPESSWSLSAPQLGLKQSEIQALQELGISTRGELQRQGVKDEVAGKIGAKLGITSDRVKQIAGSITINSARQIQVERRRSAAVTSLVGVTLKTEAALASLGFETVGQLADADVAAVSQAFGGDEARAAVAIDVAKDRVKVGG